jgi:hypothetical protein
MFAGAALAGLSSPAFAQEDPEPQAQRTINLLVYGKDACPKAGEGEIVVCGRRPESERYRIPKELRRSRKSGGEMSWKSRVEDLEAASRPSIPGSCSTSGSYGQSGCFGQMMQQWFNDRRARRSGGGR